MVTTKNFCRKIRQPKTTKSRRRPTPKNPPQNLPTNPPVKKPASGTGCFKCTPGFSRLRRRFSSWRRLQSMDSGTLFGCLQGMVEAPMLKCTCNPSAAAGGRDKLCCAPFQTTLLVKSIRFEKTTQKIKKSATRLCQPRQPKKNLVSHT